MVSNNPPQSLATAQGHLDLVRQQHRQHLSINNHDEVIDDSPENNMGTTGQAYMVAEILNISDVVHSDLTGRFPVSSRTGNNYILVSVYKNYIHATPIASRSSQDYVDAFNRTYEHFDKLKLQLKIQRMDNETSDPVEKILRGKGIEIQYVPPHNHRANRAERAIRDVKNHIIATLGSTDSSFPLYLWDEVLPQLNITINLILPFQDNTNISAYAGIHGHQFDLIMS
jgi:hypothetical protein